MSIHPIFQIIINIERANNEEMVRRESSFLLTYLDDHPKALGLCDKEGNLPLHRLLEIQFMTTGIDPSLIVKIMDKYPLALRQYNKVLQLPIHIECKNQCRSSILSRCVELFPEGLLVVDKEGNLPLHRLLRNKYSTIEAVRVLIVKYPAILQSKDMYGNLPLHIECQHRCRSSIISKCIELYPRALAIADSENCLPLHRLLQNESDVDVILMVIEKCPGVLQQEDEYGDLPLHVECENRCRSSIILKCVEVYPEVLLTLGKNRSQPLHILLCNELSSIIDILTIIEAYPVILQYEDRLGHFPLHLECWNQCRSAIISMMIDLYPEALEKIGYEKHLPLHLLLGNEASTVDDALMMIEKFPIALLHRNIYTNFPTHMECRSRCRPHIISKCFELQPESVDGKAISLMSTKINKNNFRAYASVLSIIFTARPMAMYYRNLYPDYDIADDPYYRRRILSLMPRHVFTPIHRIDYRNLNLQSRAAMIMLMSQMRRL
jgi:hypothetical protein